MRTCLGSRIPVFRRTRFAAAMLCAFAGLTHAQDGVDPLTRPAGAGRVVKAFDFEEQDFNPLPIPMGWVRAQEDPAVPRVRPGFPIWNGAVLDYRSPAFAGIGSVKLPTNGGSTSLLLRYGELSIFSNADYLVSTRVRTENLKHAHARLVATLLDQHGEAIESTRTTSSMVQSEDGWTQVAVEIEGLDPRAAYMQIELQLLQPEQQQTHKSLLFKVWDQDFDGAAWFDNLIIAQLPRLELTTGAAGNIIASNSSPDLHILVRDLTGENIYANLRVFDVNTKLVQAEVLNDDGRRVQRRYETHLPGYGWYRAIIEVVADRRIVGMRTLDFIWAPPSKSVSSSGMFSIESLLTNPKLAQATPALVHGASIDRVALRVWDRDTTLEDLEPGSLRTNIIDHLLNTGKRVSFTLAQLPQPLATTLAVDPEEVLGAFLETNGPWTAWGTQMLDQYGQRVGTLQFGSTPTLESPALLEQSLADARRALAGFVPGPTTAIVWPIDRPLPPELATPGNEIQISDDHSASPDSIARLVERWVSIHTESVGIDQAPARLGITLRPLREPSDPRGVQAWSAMGVMARKAIMFWWAASSSGLDRDRFELRLGDAWWVSKGKRGQVMPAPELLAWRTLSQHLAHREPLEAIDLMPGVRMLVISPRPSMFDESTEINDEPKGGLVLWLEQPTLDPVTLSLPLARTAVQMFDVLGNKTVIEPEKTGNVGVALHHIPITRSPIFIEGVNPELVRFLSSLNITPDMLEARSGVHKHELKINNPWSIPISGRVFIVEPGGFTGEAGDIDRSWEIDPRVLEFNLSPGEIRSFPVDFAYSLGELAGEKRLVFDVDLHADEDYPLLRVERTTELKLAGVEMEVTVKRNDAGISVVNTKISHDLDREQYFDVIAIAPGEPRIRRSINALVPGQIVSRQFAFTKPVPGDEIVVMLLPRDASTRLNKSVIVP